MNRWSSQFFKKKKRGEKIKEKATHGSVSNIDVTREGMFSQRTER